MWRGTSLILACLLVAAVAGQGSLKSAAFLSASEIETVRKNATGDIQMIVADVGRYNVAIATMRRNSTGKPESPIVHDQVTEVYYVTDGSATLVTGGTVEGGQQLPPTSSVVKILAGPTSMGGTVHDGQSRKLTKGDFVIIPAGVQHSFSSIDGSIEYLMVRVDGDRVLPTGLVHDAIKKIRQ